MNEVEVVHRQAPGPGGHFLVGSTPELRQDPLGFFLDLTRQYGDVAHIRLMGVSAFVVNRPDYIKHVLQDNNHNYSKDTEDYRMLKPVVGNGLLTNDGPDWLRQRRLIQPAFHRQKVAGFGQLMVEAAKAMLDRWAARPAPEAPLDVAEEMRRLTLRIVGEALFDVDLSDEASEVGRAFTYINEDLSGRLYDGYFIPLRIPTPRNRRFRQAKETLDKVVNDIIRERREQPDERQDLLAILIAAQDEETGQGMSDEQLHDELITLLLAGHETTAVALSWTWYLLSKYPEVMAKLHAELATALDGRDPTVDDLPNLPCTHRVLQESMRLYPPAWGISRKAEDDDVIGEYFIPAGSVIFLLPYTMHRHPDYWDDPDAFDPERFLPERAQERPQFAYFPFGGGPRLCIGADFAMVEAQLVLATVAQRYVLKLVPGHPVEPQPLITLRPRYGLHMTVRQQPDSKR
ncbi:MAG: cytochrome P450 [Candidatus Promineifilaceae bacterium]